MSVVLGFDFGTKYIGVAVGQTITSNASAIKTLMHTTTGEIPWTDLEAMIHTWRPSQLLVGIPLNLDGTEQPMTILARHFAQELQSRTGLPTIEIDERLSTWAAKQRVMDKSKAKTRRNLRSAHLSQKTRERINVESAVVLVEQWLHDHKA